MQVLGFGLWARLAAHREYHEKEIERIARIENRKSEEGKKIFSCLHVPLRRSTAAAATTSNADNRQPPNYAHGASGPIAATLTHYCAQAALIDATQEYRRRNGIRIRRTIYMGYRN